MSRRGRKTTREIHDLIGKLVAPKLVTWLGDGRLCQVENLNTKPLRCGVPEHWDALEVCRVLDYGAHIDYIHQGANGAIRGIAMRAQYWQPNWDKRWPWNTFTVRERDRGPHVEGDYLRLVVADRDEGLIGPAYMVQAYMRADAVDSVAIVRVADLLRHIDSPPLGVKPAGRRQVQGGNQMRVVGWNDLATNGAWIKQWQRKDIPREAA